MSAVATSYALTREEIESFNRNGYLGPFKLCSPDEMAKITARVETEVLTVLPPYAKKDDKHILFGQARNLDCRVIYDLCSHPAIVERMASIMGPDLVLWRSNLFFKHPGDREIPWHQDFAYWPLEPKINISAWIALDEATPENSCVQIIPGTHKQEYPSVKSPPGMEFANMTDPACYDVSKKIDMPMKPGEFILFNEKTLHHSEANRSNKRRMGLAVRVTLPSVKVDHTKLIPGHRVNQLCGVDTHRLNLVAEPPEGVRTFQLD